MLPVFDALRFLKGFQNAGVLKQLLEESGLEDHQFHPYSFSELFDAALGGAQAYYREYQDNFSYDIKMYYSHAALDDYFWLAEEYGWRHGLSRKNNAYIKQEEEYLNSFLHQDEYALTWKLVVNTKKPHGCGLVFYYSPEYMEMDRTEFAYCLFMVHHHFTERAKELRQVLADEDAAQQNRKEAA